MARLYFTLYGVLFITCALFIAGINWLPEKLLHGSIQRYYERALIGAYELVEDRLDERPPAEWDQVIEDLAQHFHHGLEIMDEAGIKKLELSDGDLKRLNNGGLVFVRIGEQTQFYRMLKRGKRTLKMVLGPNPEQEEAEQVEGIIYLIESLFIESDPAEWDQVIDGLRQGFDMPLTLLPLDDPSLPQDRMERIRHGEVAVLGANQGRETYYKRLGDSQTVFKAGPFLVPAVIQNFNVVLLGALAILIALAVYLWIRPVWRDLKRLDSGVRQFGAGELDARMQINKSSGLKQIADTFNAMAGRIQRLIQSHRELTGAVSHELRTPIARLRFRVDLLAEPLSDADRQRHIDAMRKDIVELEDLVSESLSYSRLDRERPELTLEPVSLNAWLGSLLVDMEQDWLYSPVRTELAIEAINTEIRLDQRLMSRAVKNLLRNARRHAHTTVILSSRYEDGQISIRVDDDGSGVPEHERERIFKPFARLDAARDRESGGVGLGLAIVNRIARWHGGEVLVEDSSLGGASFIIRWPVEQTSP